MKVNYGQEIKESEGKRQMQKMRAMRNGERESGDKLGERRTGQDCAGREAAAGMFHMPVLWMTWPPWSVGDTGSN